MPLKETTANKAIRPGRKNGKENAEKESKKRRASNDNDNDNGDDPAVEVPSINENQLFSIGFDCDEIRDKICEHLDHNNVKISDFEKTLHVTPAEYKSFMDQLKGPRNALKNKTYAAAHQLFTRRGSGVQGVRSSVSKKRKTESKSDDPKTSNTDAKDVKAQRKNNKAKSKDDESTSAEDLPKLDGEDGGPVPVYDTCNNVRTKIDAHLKKHKLTMKTFAEQVSKCQASGGTPVTGDQVSAFQKKNGPLAGNSTKAFYASYVWFEKLRIKEGKDKSKKRKDKSKKRKEMEDIHGEKGVMIDRAIESVHFMVPGGMKVHIDKYGHPRNSAGTW